MCAILDTNAAIQIFSAGAPEAAVQFRKYVDKGRLQLVFGGTSYRSEVRRNHGVLRFFQVGIQAGRIRQIDDRQVNTQAQMLRRGYSVESDDEHIVALAQVSGARLLYTNDRRLQGDFKNRRLINGPPGRIYSTLVGGSFDKRKKALLNSTDLCRKVNSERS